MKIGDSMKEYLKVADVFVGEYKPKRRIDAWPPSRYGETLVELSGSPAQYAAHAINSHDELVAEVEMLRDMVVRMQTYLDMAGEYPEKESDNPVRQWLFDAIDCAKQ